MHEKMHAGLFFCDGNVILQRAVLERGQDGVALDLVLVSEAIDVLFEVAVGHEFCQGVLLEVGHGA